MQKFMNAALVLGLLAACNPPSGSSPGNTDTVSASLHDSLVFKLQKVAGGLLAPVALENAHDGSNRLFAG